MLLTVVCLTLGKLCRDVKRYVMYLLCAVCNRECIEMMGATPDMLEDVKEYYKGGVSSKPPPPFFSPKTASALEAVVSVARRCVYATGRGPA